MSITFVELADPWAVDGIFHPDTPRPPERTGHPEPDINATYLVGTLPSGFKGVWKKGELGWSNLTDTRAATPEEATMIEEFFRQKSEGQNFDTALRDRLFELLNARPFPGFGPVARPPDEAQ